MGFPGRDGVVRFRILGPLEVWTGEEWRGIGAPKWRSLLAALLLNLGQPVSADRLITELWGDDAPESAANLLSVYVLRLRRLLGDAAGRFLTTRAPGYQLLLAPADLDARRFEALVKQGRQSLAARDPRQAARVPTQAPGLGPRRALALWPGRAPPNQPPSPRGAAEAARVKGSRLTGRELGAEAEIGCGLPAQ